MPAVCPHWQQLLQAPQAAHAGVQLAVQAGSINFLHTMRFSRLFWQCGLALAQDSRLCHNTSIITGQQLCCPES